MAGRQAIPAALVGALEERNGKAASKPQPACREHRDLRLLERDAVGT